MIPVLSVAAMRRVDAASTTAVDVLMDRAGLAVALVASDLGAGYGTTVAVLCGKGNNGGDGYVAASYLVQRGAAVTAYAVGTPEDGTAAARAAERARRSGVRIRPLESPRPFDVVIDAVVGTGFRGELADEVVAWSETDAVVLAVDIPSGVDGDTGAARGKAFTADVTLTFHAPKRGHVLGSGPEHSGEVIVADIGLAGGDTDLFVMTQEDALLPHRATDAHKWTAGAVATIGGVPGLTGAARLASVAALQAGAGVSAVVTAPDTTGVYEAEHPEIPTILGRGRSGSDAGELADRLARFDVLVVGPGLEPADEEFVKGLLGGFDRTVVVDAGALNVSTPESLRRDGTTILTPHAGEFARLTGSDTSIEVARRLAADADAIVVLKGGPTIVTSADAAIVVGSGGPELATIGTGDVLAGTIAAFVATIDDPLMATASAVFVHGRAGARTAETTVPTVIDLLASLGPTISELRSQ